MKMKILAPLMILSLITLLVPAASYATTTTTNEIEVDFNPMNLNNTILSNQWS